MVTLSKFDQNIIKFKENSCLFFETDKQSQFENICILFFEHITNILWKYLCRIDGFRVKNKNKEYTIIFEILNGFLGKEYDECAKISIAKIKNNLYNFFYELKIDHIFFIGFLRGREIHLQLKNLS